MRDKKVNPDLYDFLKEDETGLYASSKEGDREIIAYVHIDFDDLKEFIEIVGANCFNCGLDVQMFETTICIELNSIIEREGDSLIDYEKCFPKNDWEAYKDIIIDEWKD